MQPVRSMTNVADDTDDEDIASPLGASGLMWVPLTEGKFRERRFYIGPDAFGDPGDGLEAPTDLIDRQHWAHLMNLPTDVVLQTTDHFGSTFRAMGSLANMWISAIEPPKSLDAAEPLSSSTRISMCTTSLKRSPSLLRTAGIGKGLQDFATHLSRWPTLPLSQFAGTATGMPTGGRGPSMRRSSATPSI